MQPETNSVGRRRATPGKTLAFITTLILSAAPGLHAATPEPLPPPPELLNDAGYAIDAGIGRPYQGAQNHYPSQPYQAQTPLQSPTNRQAPSQQRNFSRMDDAPYDPYATPASAYLPPLPGVQDPTRTATGTGSAHEAPPATRYTTAIPEMQPPPMVTFPGQPYPAQGGFAVSPPSASMPEDYFNLPFLEAGIVQAGIPGVLLPEFNEDFFDPGMYDARTGKRILQRGMDAKQLEPYFDLAKGSEKAALEAKKRGDEQTTRIELKKAVDSYMEIIAMADAGNEAREEAWYGVGRCEYRRENWWQAFDAIERSFPKDFDRGEVAGRIKLEMFIGERLWRVGHGKVPGARGEPMTGYQAASKVYAAAIFNQPGAQDAPLALLRRGDAAAMEGDWKEAAKFYRTVIQYYPESEPAMQARSSLAEAVYRQEWPAGFPEAARTDLAVVMDDVEYNERLLSPPAEERRQRAVILANDLEAGDKLRQAKAYMTKMRVKKSRDAAVFLLGDIISHYPNTAQAREAAGLLRGMGIQPPMVLSDGRRFPLTPPVAGAALMTGREEGAGLARVERQDMASPPPRHNEGGSYGQQPELGYSPAPYNPNYGVNPHPSVGSGDSAPAVGTTQSWQY